MIRITKKEMDLGESRIEITLEARDDDICDLYNFGIYDEVMLLRRDVYERLRDAYQKLGGL